MQSPISAQSVWVRAAQSPPTALPVGKLWDWLKTALDAALYRPCAAPGVVARRLREDGVTYYVLKNPATNAYLKLSESDYALWEWMDGTRSVKDLVVAYFEQYHTLAFGRVSSLVGELKAAGFLADRPVNVFQQAREQLTRRDWTFRWRRLARAFIQHEFALSGIDRWMAALYRYGGRLLFTPAAQVALALLALAGFVGFVEVLTSQRYTIVATAGSYWLGLLLLWLVNFIIIIIHEHAHALTTKHFGREVRRGGLLIYYGMPAFFVDTMDIWLEPKPRRLAVTWAGPYSGLIIGGLCGLAAALLPPGLLAQLMFKTAFVCYVGVLVNLNPLLELDGYFILIDWLGIPNLRERSFAFIRTELFNRLKMMLAAAPVKGPTTAFTREETILTAFGLLAAVYTIYTLVVALYFWQTRFSVMLTELWNRPSWVARLAAIGFGAAVGVPVALVVAITLWNGGRQALAYLNRRRFFESNRNVSLTLLAGLSVVVALPAMLSGMAWTVYASCVPPALLMLAALMLIRTARRYAGSYFQYSLWALAVAALLLLGGALARSSSILFAFPGELPLPLYFEQLAAVPLLVIAFQFLLQVDIRASTLGERLGILTILASSFVIAIPPARWTAAQPWPAAMLAVAGPFFTAILLAAAVSILGAHLHTRFFVAWALLTLGIALNGALCLARLSPGWPLGADPDVWLSLVKAGLWAAGSVGYILAEQRLPIEAAHWSDDLLLSDGERLRLAFVRFFETLFKLFGATYGAQRARALDNDLDVLSVTANWDVEIDGGHVRDELDLSRIAILDQADRYRDVLTRTIDLMDDWAGSVFIRRATQAAYDSLPWPEREILGQYVLAGAPWGGAIAKRFDSARSERYRLLQQVPLFSACSNRAMALIMAAVKSETVSAGTVLGRQGANVTRFVIVQSGAIEKWVRPPAGPRDELVGTLRRGASFGSEAFMGGGVYSGTYRAAVTTDILYLSVHECNNLMRAGVKLASQVGQALAIRQLLGQMPLFASLGPQQLDAVIHKLERREAAAGEIIVRQGESRHHFYIIASGQVAASVTAPDGQEHLVAHLGPGQHFGETALYQDVPYTATCRAVVPTTLLALDESAFDAMVGSSAQMSHYVEQVSSGRVIDTRRKLGLSALV